MYEIRPHQILASAYAMIVLTGIAIILRFFLRGLRKDPLLPEDGFMLFAFVTFCVLATITIVVVPVAYQIIAVSYDLRPIYNGLFDDEVGLVVGEVVVIVTFEEVAVSAAGMDEALVTYFGNWISTLTTCVPIQGYFKPGGCNSDRDVKAQIANLYYVVVTEILTDIL
ncbi:hypothetical protein F66182_14342, partial [Fusarium sp. NRRL 66182]